MKIFNTAAPDISMLEKAYQAFNERDINTVLSFMRPDVRWPNGWEGGYVNGHQEVENYWKRQWQELDPHVDPVAFEVLEDGRIEILVHQVVRDTAGKLLSDGMVKHLYTVSDNLIESMEIAIAE